MQAKVTENSPETDLLARWMGWVVALRLLSWAAGLSVLCGLALVEAGRRPEWLKALSLPFMFVLYLGSTGYLLLLYRLQTWAERGLACLPWLALGAVFFPQVSASPPATLGCLFLGMAGLAEALARQARRFQHARSQAWFERLARRTLPVLVGVVWLPGASAPVAAIGGTLILGSLVVGWRLWLLELRHSIAQQERLSSQDEAPPVESPEQDR